MKEKSVDMLLNKHRLISNLSSIALISLLVAILILAVSWLDGGERYRDQVGSAMGLVLGSALVFSLLSMIGSTFYVIRKRISLSDWKIFLVVVWLVPYLGVSAYLGGANFMTFKRMGSE